MEKKRKLYKLETFALPAPNFQHYVGDVTIEVPEGHALHSWRVVAAEGSKDATFGYAAVLWEKTS